MRIWKPFYLLSGTLLLGGLALVCAQTKVIKEVPVHATNTLNGSDLYHEFCAVCHGVDGRGNGPAAEALKKAPTDLTQLALKNNGKFPTLAVQMSIKGPSGIIEHGTGDMPIWGQALRQAGQNRDFVEMRVYALTKYVEQIQAR
ncbi:MAG TPA: c-type cytochrome [Bryobacteraceae bacterium]|nr:c-type cytochrome [Bryobacteraceae bacterium]